MGDTFAQHTVRPFAIDWVVVMGYNIFTPTVFFLFF
jgi:hypothetical protein